MGSFGGRAAQALLAFGVTGVCMWTRRRVLGCERSHGDSERATRALSRGGVAVCGEGSGCACGEFLKSSHVAFAGSSADTCSSAL